MATPEEKAAAEAAQKLNEHRLKVVTAKKESAFALLQSIYDMAKKLKDDGNQVSFYEFNNKYHNVESLKNTCLSCIDEINELNFLLNPNKAKPSFTDVETVYELYGYIQRKHAQFPLVDPKKDAPEVQFQSKVKLPVLDLKVFSGDPTEWPLWYESFKSLIDQNKDLSNTQKVQYLMSKLSHSALSVCIGILPTADNYALILQALVQKYDDKRTLAMSYLDKLFKFKQIKTESATQLNNFIDQFSASVSALNNLGIQKLDDFIILAIALGKLDPETTKLFEMSVKESEFPTFEQLDTFIKEQAKMLGRMPRNFVKIEPQQVGTSHKVSHKPVFHSFVVEKARPQFCISCNKSQHPLFSCDQFLKLTPVQRYELVKQHRVCINCLNPGHIGTGCQSKHTCKQCSGRHNTLLHFKERAPTRVPNPQLGLGGTSQSSDPGVSCCSTEQTPVEHTVLLSTVKVCITDQIGKVHVIRMLLDSGSMNHFITFSCAKKLGLVVHNNPSTVQGIGSTSKSVSGQTCFTFSSRFDQNISFSVQALVVDHVTNKLPTCRIDKRALKHLQGLQTLADDTFYEPQGISGILAASLWPLLIDNGKIMGEPNCPVGVNTKLGVVVMGTAPTYSPHSENSFCAFTESSLDNMVSSLWELEQIPECHASPYNEEEAWCEDYYKSTVSRDKSGRFTVALPFKESPSVLGESYSQASNRLLSLEKKLDKNSEFRSGYNEAIQDFIDSGHMSLCNNDVSGVFLSHFAVIKASSSTPIRPVFDGSCPTTSKKSLNDILFAGPNIYSDLLVVLLNFRLFSIAVSADIRKMFRQIFVRSEDREFQKVLWRFDPLDPISVYTLNTVTFGVKPSPWLALRTVKQLVVEEAEHYPLAAGVVSRDIYMDDIATSLFDEKQAEQLYSQLIELFKSGGFELVKWASSSLSLLQQIPESDRLCQNLEWDSKSFSKILGMQWNAKEDSFCFQIDGSTDSVCTKRSILSFAARIWDILGFLCPVIVRIKILLQQLWSLKLGWDETPPHHIVNTWNNFRIELQSLSQLSIPRHIGVPNDKVPITLVGYSDASAHAYACVIYCRIVYPSGDVTVSFVTGKTKIAPLSTVSIPKLELLGTMILSKLMRFVINTYQSRCTISSVVCFSDSTVALNWIAGCPSRWNVFVANRITKIQENIDKKSWFYCQGTDNPADLATRGLTPTELMSQDCIWFTGPSWLSLTDIEPYLKPVQVMNSVPEEKKSVFISVDNQSNCSYTFFSPIFQKYSSWSKLQKTFVYVLRFAKLLPHGGVPTHTDLQVAEHFILKIVQKHHFKTLYLSDPQSYLPNLRKLDPFIEGGLVRVGGRLVHSNLEYEQKHPLLLPQKDHVVSLLVKHYHEHNLHTGSGLLFSLLRNNYWILGARNLVRKIVRSCNHCFRRKPEARQPFMGNLPDYRVQPAVKAFVHTGMDMAGPFHITMSRHRGIKSQKAYVCLFICLSTKALYLDLCSDLSTMTFISALKRFLARRGPVLHLYSDNGTNFVGAKNHLDEVYSFLASRDYLLAMQNELDSHRITWKFSVPAGPHMSGIWESAVKSVKTHLYKTITQVLSFESMSTVLAQVECLLNSRPLCPLSSDDTSEPVALTPAHFLTYQPLSHLPARNVLSEPPNRLTRFELLDQMVQNFWKRWSSEYLNTLQARSKWDKHVPPITVGTIVVIKQDSYTPPLQWLLGRVIKTYPGADGVVRVAEVKTKLGIFKRPVVKLCPLPTQ